jgi:hypothetical protein
MLQEAEEQIAQKESEVNENIRVQLKLQEDTAAARSDVQERTTALAAAVKVCAGRLPHLCTCLSSHVPAYRCMRERS